MSGLDFIGLSAMAYAAALLLGVVALAAMWFQRHPGVPRVAVDLLSALVLGLILLHLYTYLVFLPRGVSPSPFFIVLRILANFLTVAALIYVLVVYKGSVQSISVAYLISCLGIVAFPLFMAQTSLLWSEVLPLSSPVLVTGADSSAVVRETPACAGWASSSFNEFERSVLARRVSPDSFEKVLAPFRYWVDQTLSAVSFGLYDLAGCSQSALQINPESTLWQLILTIFKIELAGLMAAALWRPVRVFVLGR